MEQPHPPHFITAEHVTAYLLAHRDFFQEQPHLLKRLELPHIVGANTISLQAKQVNVLRHSLTDRQTQLTTLLTHAKNNEVILQGLHQITLCLLAQRSVVSLLDAAQESIAHVFGLQDSAIRLWGVEPQFQQLPCNQRVSDDIKTFAEGLKHPYCGASFNFRVQEWLPRSVASMAMIALRVTPNSRAFGLFIVGSQDAEHFSAEKNTDFLVQLGQILSASFGRMLPPYS